MKHNFKMTTAVVFAGLAGGLILGHAPAQAQEPAAKQAAKGKGGGFIKSNDPRVQNRTYHVADTNEDLPYCVFVSSKVSKDKKNPLIISLHGLGIGPGYMCQGKAIDEAEAGGYILAAPMGYNTGGWYGSPIINTGGRGGKGAPAPEAPANLSELSEKDAMNVLDTMRKEFNVDERRTYLMGHSMGGAGTLYLGSKYASNWAAIAAMAPAAMRMAPNASTILQPLKDKSVAVMIAQGDADELVPVAGTRKWVDTMKEMNMVYNYKEVPGATHGSVIEASIPDIFAFFKDHTK
ncbi:MAG TPA: alpha/beta hydrolase-fold protein [Bryobacteraceae bacterium]|jgi:predicted peptidase|nr:alpha/beta hydrolase-fold protein [Bryobacteraceae bacterium]